MNYRQVGAPSQQQFDMHINGKNHKEREVPTTAWKNENSSFALGFMFSEVSTLG